MECTGGQEKNEAFPDLLAGKDPCNSKQCPDRCRRGIARQNPHSPACSHTGTTLRRTNA